MTTGSPPATRLDTQTSDNVSITGGSLSGVAVNGSVGGATPAAGAFTTLTASGTASITGAATIGGALSLTGSASLPSATGIAAAGTTIADATALTKMFNNVTTVAGSTGVILPASVVGVHVYVSNAGASVCKVYAPGSDSIDGTAGATGVSLTNAKRCMYYCIATNAYVSAQMGVASA